MERYDSIIVGSGPSGLAAAINLRIRGKSFLLIGTENLSPKLEAAPKIDNYLGFPGISGRELSQRYRDHLRDMEIALTCEHVISIYHMGNYYALATVKNTYEATTVILATGTSSFRLLPGEERLLGHGVGYCATCDAPLYRGKTVAIIGFNDDSAFEANFVSELAATVYYISMKKTDKPLREGIISVNGPVVEIIGDKKVEYIKTAGQTLAVDGVFVLRESIAPASLVPGIAIENGFIAVDGEMRTNLPGCFAAGDCTGKPHQIMRAVGQGQIAALTATAYIDFLKLER